MKNKKVFSAVSVMAVLAMISCGFVGATFAKYVSQGDGKDTARVAKWGVVITGSDDVFDESYNKDDINSGLTGSTVISESGNVVAPGTEKIYDGIQVNGEPEVAVRVLTEVEVDLGDEWVDENGAYYCPLVFTVDGTEIKGLDCESIDAFENSIKDAIEQIGNGVNVNGEYVPGTQLADQNISTSFSWEWPFSVSDENDEKDTFLGNLSTPPAINIAITTTVTQID